MFEIDNIKIENSSSTIVTDNLNPTLSFSLKSDKKDTFLKKAEITCCDFKTVVEFQTGIKLDIKNLDPFKEYEVNIKAFDNFDNEATKSVIFKTGRLNTKWDAKFISLKDYKCEKGESPIPFTFKKEFKTTKTIKKAFINSTALGIYYLFLNGKRIGNQYFAPGLTSYKHVLQYQYYDVTDLIKNNNNLIALVGPGWAAGRFTYESKSKITVDKEMLLLELFIEYEDGTSGKIISDSSWDVTSESNCRFGDFYDGETYDARVDLNNVKWEKAHEEKLKFKPQIEAEYGEKVIEHEHFKPINHFMSKDKKEMIYDFGQNFAGIVQFKVNAKEGQKIKIRHAELLENGNLCVKSLRTAKATINYTCREGMQEYSPLLTYMGFRYIGVSGVDPSDIEIKAVALYSDINEIGSFSCSNEMINRLQNNIIRSGKSNFVDIPTDCPQRDERQGWTGDIALFASTACYNFDMTRFLSKWLKDMRYEQGHGGGIPVVVPKQGSSVPVVAVACWSDSCILVPYAAYLESGDKAILLNNYSMMKKYLKAVKFWAGFSGPGKYQRNIWKLLYQYGDWCASSGNVMEWMSKGKWIATAFYANSANLLAKVANILGYEEDVEYYNSLFLKIPKSFIKVLTDGNGHLKKEFQTGYVLPLYFNMLDEKNKMEFAKNLNKLVIENNYHLSTGFPGTPYLLFALADNGYIDTASKLLLQDTCPSWLYTVKMGGTTTWEQWNAVSEDENLVINDTKNGTMVSLNHYAYGAVGDFLYRRILGIEPTEGGYKKFVIKPIIMADLTYAKGEINTRYGIIKVDWKIENNVYYIDIKIPVSTECELIMPISKKHMVLTSGSYLFKENM